MASHLEQRFAFNWRAISGQPFVAEFRFYKPRMWRFDFAWPDSKIAVEIEGGVWSGGRHTRGSGFIEDCRKYNQAALDGWRVFRLAGDMVDDLDLLRRIKEIVR